MCTDLLSHFSAIQDPRSDKNKLYDLETAFLDSFYEKIPFKTEG